MTTTDTEWVNGGYGAVVAALRDDAEGIRAAFTGLPAEHAAALAEAALLAMGVAVRSCTTPDSINDLITAVQAVAADDANTP